MNNFVNQGIKNSALTLTENGALNYAYTSDEFLTQFGSISGYRKPREWTQIHSDMASLFAIDQQKAVQMALFIRMISRLNNVTSNQDRGAGMRHEGLHRFIWLGVHHPELFWNNINLYISVASVEDIFEMLRWNTDKYLLDNDKLIDLVINYLADENQSELVKKYLPQIYSSGKANTKVKAQNTEVAKTIAKKLGISYKEYRQLKVSGTAHRWQQLISLKEMKLIDFGSIHGRALMNLSKSKFFENQGLVDKYLKFLDGQSSLKYTGQIVDLFTKMNRSNILRNKTIDKQFLSTLDETKSNLIVVRDTSRSMGDIANGLNMSCYDVAKALALWFSYNLKGHFENAWIEFNSTAKMHLWKGSTPTERWFNDESFFVGSTNFQSVIELFGELLKSGVSESDFPEGIICITDKEYDSSSASETNLETAKKSLKEAGFSQQYIDNFKVILWALTRGNSVKFESFDDHKNIFYFGGYSPEIIYFLTGKEVIKGEEQPPKDAIEVMNAALNQPTLQLVQI